MKPYRSIGLCGRSLHEENLKELTLTEMKILYCEISQEVDPPKFSNEEEAMEVLTPLLRSAILIVNTPVRRQVMYNRPFVGKIRSPRLGSKVETMIRVLGLPGGATLEECLATTGVSRNKFYSLMKSVLHEGYGLREDLDGRIHLVSE